MRQLLHIEWIKQSNFGAFKVLLILHFSLFCLMMGVLSFADFNGMEIGKVMLSFPNSWSVTTWIASWFNFLLGIIGIIIVGNEFSYLTFRQQVLIGQSRSRILHGKLLVMLILSIYGFLLTFSSSAITGLVFTTDWDMVNLWDSSYLILIYLLQTISYMVFGMFIALLFRNNALSICMFLLYGIIIEPLIRVFLPYSVSAFFPMKVISNLTPMPKFLDMFSEMAGVSVQGGGSFSNTFSSQLPQIQSNLSEGTLIIVAILYIGLFYALSQYFVRSRNL